MLMKHFINLAKHSLVLATMVLTGSALLNAQSFTGKNVPFRTPLSNKNTITVGSYIVSLPEGFRWHSPSVPHVGKAPALLRPNAYINKHKPFSAVGIPLTRTASTQKAEASSDSATVTFIIKCDSTIYMPNSGRIYMYNTDFWDYIEEFEGEPFLKKIPVGKYDFMNVLWRNNGNISAVIKELVDIRKDTTITIDQSEANRSIPIKCVDKDGNDMLFDVIRYHYDENDNLVSTDTLRKGNINEAFMMRYIYLKGQGRVHNYMTNCFEKDPDMEEWKDNRMFEYYVNKLSDRYILECCIALTGKDGQHYIVKEVSNNPNDTALVNKKEDWVDYEETFKPTPMGENSEKGHVMLYRANELFNGMPVGSVSPNSGPLAGRDNKSIIHVCAKKDYGINEYPYDLSIIPALGDKYMEKVDSFAHYDENDNLIGYETDTARYYLCTYGQQAFSTNNGIEYFNSGHDVYGNKSFQYDENGNLTDFYPGHKAFSYMQDKRRGIYGNNCPINSFMQRNGYNEELGKKTFYWDPCYIGRLGEVRMTDAAAAKYTVKYNNEPIKVTNAEEFANNWAQEEHSDGVWDITMENDNIMVDSIQGKNITHLYYDQRKDDWTAPILQMLQFRNSDGIITDRFENGQDGFIEFAGGDFNWNPQKNSFKIAPMTTKVEYAPYGTNKWKELNVEEIPELYKAPQFGYFYRGSLSNIERTSSNGWYDLKLTLTDTSGNYEEQTVSPAFKMNIANAIKEIGSDKELQENVIYDLFGRRINKPQQGVYILNGKKYIAK